MGAIVNQWEVPSKFYNAGQLVAMLDGKRKPKCEMRLKTVILAVKRVL